jgi:hypothetical protein
MMHLKVLEKQEHTKSQISRELLKIIIREKLETKKHNIRIN